MKTPGESEGVDQEVCESISEPDCALARKVNALRLPNELRY